jgi:hypothetical protein
MIELGFHDGPNWQGVAPQAGSSSKDRFNGLNPISAADVALAADEATVLRSRYEYETQADAP